jgi:thioredoxin 1
LLRVASGNKRSCSRVCNQCKTQSKGTSLATIATTDTFETEVIKSDGKVIVDFWAEWCGPCHAVSPVLDRIADEHQVKIVKVNIDEQQDLAQRYGVSSIPFMVLFEDGVPQASAVGAYPKGALEKMLGLAEA